MCFERPNTSNACRKCNAPAIITQQVTYHFCARWEGAASGWGAGLVRPSHGLQPHFVGWVPTNPQSQHPPGPPCLLSEESRVSLEISRRCGHRKLLTSVSAKDKVSIYSGEEKGEKPKINKGTCSNVCRLCVSNTWKHNWNGAFGNDVIGQGCGRVCNITLAIWNNQKHRGCVESVAYTVSPVAHLSKC